MTSTSKAQIQHLTSEILLMLFHRLEAIETARSMRVCRRWYELLRDHKFLWRQLILPHTGDEAASPSKAIMALDSFDKRSGSGLTRFSMTIDGNSLDDSVISKDSGIVELLLKSKKSLEAVQVFEWKNSLPMALDRTLMSKLGEFSSLVDFRISSSYDRRSPVLLRTSGPQEPSEDRRQKSDEVSDLKIVWVPRLWDRLPNDGAHLVSLKVEWGRTQQSWRKILERSSQTLKHVDIQVIVGAEQERAQHEESPALYFPNLKIMIMKVHCKSFLSWIKTPPSSTLIIDSFWGTPMTLQSCSELWINVDMITDSYQWLVGSFPALSELRIHREVQFLRLRVRDNIVDIVRQRQRNAESGMQIEGVTMRRLRTLVLPLSLVAKELLPGFLSQLKEMVEVVDIDDVSRFIELEI